MNYTIEFDLDYDGHPYQEVQEIWHSLRNTLITAGFRARGRRFTINLAPAQARQLTRRSIEQLAARLRQQDKSLYRYIREFYGYPSHCSDNLLLPPTEAIEVRIGVL